jgi:SAM-dependent methyltransferase
MQQLSTQIPSVPVAPKLPATFQETVDELSELLQDQNVTSLAERVWREALSVGVNVVAASEGKITPHQYDAQMEQFYKTTDAFVIETVVESQRSGKRQVMERVIDRIHRKLQSAPDSELNVLMLGDGSGGDTLTLAAEFGARLNLVYFDVPGSLTFDFAMRRFSRYGVQVEIITEYNEIPKGTFDVLVSLEVLEHLPDPVRAVRDMRQFLRTNGIALITESFNGVKPQFPTHLSSNLQFHRNQYLLFTRQGFRPTYMHGKPMEFAPSEHVLSKLIVEHPKLAVRHILSMIWGPLILLRSKN